MAITLPKKTCAICVALVLAHEGGMHPLGRNDAMVFVCERCSGERAVTKNGPELGYASGGGFPTRAAVKQATDRVFGKMTRGQRNLMAKHLGEVKPVQPGYCVVRVRRRFMGRDRDHVEAAAACRWTNITYLGATAGFFIFQRPIPKRIDKRVKSPGYVHKPDPLEPIAQYRSA